MSQRNAPLTEDSLKSHASLIGQQKFILAMGCFSVAVILLLANQGATQDLTATSAMADPQNGAISSLSE